MVVSNLPTPTVTAPTGIDQPYELVSIQTAWYPK
jgi:hypothetical protein